MILCPKCGYDNDLGRIFCHQCGTKLDLSEIKPPSRGGKDLRKRARSSSRRMVSLGIRLLVLALLLWSLWLLAQVPSVSKPSTTNADLVSFGRKRSQLEAAEAQLKAVKVALTEAEINAFIAGNTFEKAKGTGLRVTPEMLCVEIRDGVVRVAFTGTVSVGSWDKGLGLSYTGRPAIEHGAFVLKPVAAAIGELPIHPLILEHMGLVQSYFAHLFHNLEDERKLLDQLTSVSVDHQQLLLGYDPAAAKP